MADSRDELHNVASNTVYVANDLFTFKIAIIFPILMSIIKAVYK